MFLRAWLNRNRPVISQSISPLQNLAPKRDYYADVGIFKKLTAKAVMHTSNIHTALVILDRGNKFNLEEADKTISLDLDAAIKERKYTDLFGIKDDLIYFKSAEFEINGVSQRPINLSMLYSIPQKNWDEFVAKLPHEYIVKALGLNKHRHLWMGYNIVIQASANQDDRMKLANLFGAYHFTQDLWLSSTYDLAEMFKYYRYYTPEQSAYLNQQLQTLKAELDAFEFSLKTLQTLHPCFKQTLLRKVAHCINFEEVIRIADTILHHSADELLDKSQLSEFNPSVHSINAKTFQDSTDWVVSSKTAGRQFGNMVSTLNKQYGFPGIFFNERKNWDLYAEKFKTFNPERWEIYFNALFRDLIARSIYQKNINKEMKVFEGINLMRVTRYEFRKLMLEHHTAHQLDILEQRYQRNITTIKNVLPGPDFTWLPLTDTHVEGSITITPLTSRSSLKFYGRMLDNCLGGYYSKAMEGNCNLFLVNGGDEDKEHSILDVRYSDGKFVIEQHGEIRNSSPSDVHREAAKNFVKKLNQGQIAIHSERLHEKVHIFDSLIQYDVNDLETQRKIYDIYKDNKLLPKILIANSYENMLANSGMELFIEHAAQKNLDDHIYSQCNHDRAGYLYYR